MGDLSEHFSKSELACKCGCGLEGWHKDLIPTLEEIRLVWELRYPGAFQGVRVRSAYRCMEHDLNVRGTREQGSHGPHVYGIAVDINPILNGSPPPSGETLVQFLREGYPYFRNHGGIGIADTWIHVDLRGLKTEWRY